MMGLTYDSITHNVVEIRYRHLISCSRAQKIFELSGPPKHGDPRGYVGGPSTTMSAEQGWIWNQGKYLRK